MLLAHPFFVFLKKRTPAGKKNQREKKTSIIKFIFMIFCVLTLNIRHKWAGHNLYYVGKMKIPAKKSENFKNGFSIPLSSFLCFSLDSWGALSRGHVYFGYPNSFLLVQMCSHTGESCLPSF